MLIKLVRNLPALRSGQLPDNCTRVCFMSQWGPMAITASTAGIHRLEFISADEPVSDSPSQELDPNMRNAIDYLAGREVNGAILLSPVCTGFQFSVYQALVRIPLGLTVSYGAIAEAIGNPRATRAAAGAIAKNSIAVLIPCHRVTPAAGGYGNYRWGARLKAELIEAEKRAAKTLPAN